MAREHTLGNHWCLHREDLLRELQLALQLVQHRLKGIIGSKVGAQVDVTALLGVAETLKLGLRAQPPAYRVYYGPVLRGFCLPFAELVELGGIRLHHVDVVGFLVHLAGVQHGYHVQGCVHEASALFGEELSAEV